MPLTLQHAHTKHLEFQNFFYSLFLPFIKKYEFNICIYISFT